MSGYMRRRDVFLGTASATVILFACCGVGRQALASEADQRTTFVEQPRPYGYFIGDIVTQRILLNPAGEGFRPAEPPGNVRVNAWFERRSVRLDRRGGERWLVVSYQVVNAPRTAASATLPGWRLEEFDGAAPLPIPAASITIAPLSPTTMLASEALTNLRADRPAPTIETAPLRRQLRIWFIAFVLTLAAWAVWLYWRNLRAARQAPFARALRELRRLDDSASIAWEAMHRAFDATARQVVRLESLDVLFARAPHFEPYWQAIETFYRQSTERFFGVGAPAQSLSVRTLCRDLRRAEKQREQ